MSIEARADPMEQRACSSGQDMSSRAMEVIKRLDSRSFGFLDFQQVPLNGRGNSGTSSGAAFVSKDFINQGIMKLREQLSTSPFHLPDATRGDIFCQLGHLHLLLEEYKEALSAYQQYRALGTDSSHNPSFLYGLGLIYFHFNAYKWAIEVFQKVLRLDVDFARANEIYLRLGIMLKAKGELGASKEHLQKALSIRGPSSLNRLEVQFHLGHILHLQGDVMGARRAFEGILATKSVPNVIRAMTLRQLGWLYHTAPEVVLPTEDTNCKAIELLKLAVGADPTSGQTWYFLGRCHAAQGRVHEAFMAYQQAVNKALDDQADVWCSIGVLYHNMGQPRDSLQAYLCAVYLDVHHTAAWSNLGCLFESIAQPVDALLSYKNAATALTRAVGKYRKTMEFVSSRISNLEQYILMSGPSLATQTRYLPSLHDAWYSLIPSHIRSRQHQTHAPLLQLSDLPMPPMPPIPPSPILPSFAALPLPPGPGNVTSKRHTGPAPKRPRLSKAKDPIILRSMNERLLGSGLTSPLTPGLSPSLFSPSLIPPFQPGMGIGNENGTNSPFTGMGNADFGMGPLNFDPIEPGPQKPIEVEPLPFRTHSSNQNSRLRHSSNYTAPNSYGPGPSRDSPTLPHPLNSIAVQHAVMDTLNNSRLEIIPGLNPQPHPHSSLTNLNVDSTFCDTDSVYSNVTDPEFSQPPSNASSANSERPGNLALAQMHRKNYFTSSAHIPLQPNLTTPTSLSGNKSSLSSPASPASMQDEHPFAMTSSLQANPSSMARSSDPLSDYSSNTGAPFFPAFIPGRASNTPGGFGLSSVGPLATLPFSNTDTCSLLKGSQNWRSQNWRSQDLRSQNSRLQNSRSQDLRSQNSRSESSSYSITSMPRLSLSSGTFPDLGSMSRSSPGSMPRSITSPTGVAGNFSRLSQKSQFQTNMSPFQNPRFSSSTPTSLLVATTNSLPGSHTGESFSLISPRGLGSPFSDLPGDLTFIDPLNLGCEAPKVEDYMTQYLSETQEGGRQQLAARQTGRERRNSKELQCARNQKVTNSQVKTQGSNFLMPSPVSPNILETLLTSPDRSAAIESRSPLQSPPDVETSIINTANNRVSPAINTPTGNVLSLENRTKVHLESLPQGDSTHRDGSLSPIKAHPHEDEHGNARSTNLDSSTTVATAENVSDSGVSSASTKLSTTSSTSSTPAHSPCLNTSLMESFSSPTHHQHFTYPPSVQKGLKSPAESPLTPIYVGQKGLKSPAESPLTPIYMGQNGLKSPAESPLMPIYVGQNGLKSPAESPLMPIYVGQNGLKSPEESLLTPIYEPFPFLGDEGEYMVQDPELRPPDPPMYTEEVDLRPSVPIFEVSSREEAISDAPHAFCTNPTVPICMIRGLVSALDIDLDLFSTKGLVETCPNQEMEVREQIPQAADENWDVGGRKLVWRCESNQSFTTIEEYADYQFRVLQQGREDDSTMSDLSDSVSEGGSGGGVGGGGGRQRGKKKLLRFGTNVDLSDQQRWERQLTELKKLPKFLQVSRPEANFLTHIGHAILGMNSVQLYMKVPGSRTPGHQENNSFCSININIGPGDCEWFAVHNRYWGVFHDLCEKHKLSFLVGSWWPVLEELYENKVPVYRFTQYVGDVVYINPGTVHWVQANNVCNNIAWNTGPLTAHQFRMSWERYQWNKIQRVRSIVPMIHLTWSVARTVKITNEILYQQIRSLLESSLSQSRLLLSHLTQAHIPIHWHGHTEGEPTPTCTSCLEEVFNILFVISHKEEYLVYCHKCAGALRKTFTVLQQYKTEELERILSNFRLHKPVSH